MSHLQFVNRRYGHLCFSDQLLLNIVNNLLKNAFSCSLFLYITCVRFSNYQIHNAKQEYACSNYIISNYQTIFQLSLQIQFNTRVKRNLTCFHRNTTQEYIEIWSYWGDQDVFPLHNFIHQNPFPLQALTLP
jgi:hypothetical protein